MNRRMMSVAAAIVLAVLGTIGYFWNQPEQGASVLGREAPDFELKDATGKSWRLSKDGQGRAVVLHFWASWCQPCLSEIPIWLDAAREDMKKSSSGALWVAVSLDESWEKAHSILPAEGLPENVVSLLDIEQKVPGQFGTYQFPESYLLGGYHRVLRKWVGAQNWETVSISDAVAADPTF